MIEIFAIALVLFIYFALGTLVVTIYFCTNIFGNDYRQETPLHFATIVLWPAVIVGTIIYAILSGYLTFPHWAYRKYRMFKQRRDKS